MVCKTRFLSCLGETLMRRWSWWKCLISPVWQKKAAVWYLFIQYLWCGTKERSTHWKSWNFVVRNVAVLFLREFKAGLSEAFVTFSFCCCALLEWTLSKNRFIYNIRLLILFMFYILVCLFDFYNLKKLNENHCSNFHKV